MTRNGWFVYGNFDTRSLGLTVMPVDIDGAPARNFTVQPRVGRNGDFVIDTGRFGNVARMYGVLIRSNFRAAYEALCAALLPLRGYYRLTDAWNPDEYYLAYLGEGLMPTVSPNEDRGTVLISFTRQPQRWLLSGESWTAIYNGTLTNPTAFSVRPLIRIQIESNLTETDIDSVPSLYLTTINGIMLQIYGHDFVGELLRNNLGEYIMCDYSDRRVYIAGKPAYDDSINQHLRMLRNDGSYFYVYYGDFPEILPGDNTVSLNSESWYSRAEARWGWFTV